MEKAPVTPKQLDAMLITHEHQDHVRGAGVVSRRYDLPVYLTRGTLESLPSQVGRLAHVQIFQSGVSFVIGDLEIHPFATSHDASEPAGFVIEHEGCRLGVCTDLGVVTQLVKVRLQGCHGLIIEANHDLDLLLNGPYPWPLKQRIRSRHGHLSNPETFELVQSLHHDGIQGVVFAHLSEVNNSPTLVSQLFHDMLRLDEWSQTRFSIGNQYEPIAGVELE